MRLICLLGVCLIFTTFSFCRPSPSKLKVVIVTHDSQNPIDFRLDSLFKTLIYHIKTDHPDFPFEEIDFVNFSYNDDPNFLGNSTIATLTPTKFIEAKKELGDKIKPIFVVQKRNEKLAYYSSLIIASKFAGDNIEEFNSPHIKRFYVVSETSTSGYIAPIYMLWRSGLIESPNEKAIVDELNWKVIRLNSHREVVERVKNDINSIGAVWHFENWDNPKIAEVKLLKRYFLIPQDPMIISQDLLKYEESIRSWFISLFEKDDCGNLQNLGGQILMNSSKKITGLDEYNHEFELAFTKVEMMHGVVSGDQKYIELANQRVIPRSYSTLNELVSYFGDLKPGEFYGFIGSIITIISFLVYGSFWFGKNVNVIANKKKSDIDSKVEITETETEETIDAKAEEEKL